MAGLFGPGRAGVGPLGLEKAIEFGIFGGLPRVDPEGLGNRAGHVGPKARPLPPAGVIGGKPLAGIEVIRRRSEQNSVHQFLVLIGDGGQLFGHGEHHMEVLSIEDLRPPVVQPSRTGQRLAFRAMPISAGVIRDALAAAMVTLLDMAAERGGPTEFDRRHDAALDGGQRGVMLLTISVAVAAEYIRDLQL